MDNLIWTWCPHCGSREDHDLINGKWICHTCKQSNPFVRLLQEYVEEEMNDIILLKNNEDTGETGS